MLHGNMMKNLHKRWVLSLLTLMDPSREGGGGYLGFEVTGMVQGFFEFQFSYSMSFWGRKIWQVFLAWFKKGFFGVLLVGKDKFRWYNEYQNTSILIFFFVLYHSPLSRNLRVRNSAFSDFKGVGFLVQQFFGFVGSPWDFFESWFLSPFDHLRHLKFWVPPWAYGNLTLYKRSGDICLWEV